MSSNNTQPTGKVTSPTKLAHIVLRTSPAMYKKQIDFYLTFLGAKIQYSNDMLAFLTYDEEHHRIAIVAIPELAPKNPMTSGLEHFAFTFDSLNILLETYRQRKSHGINPIWCVNHGPTMSLYYRDPDGNTIETQVDAFDNNEDANAFMMGPEYAENPLGVDFDPEEVIEKLKRGESEKDIMKRPNIGPRDLSTIPLVH